MLQTDKPTHKWIFSTKNKFRKAFKFDDCTNKLYLYCVYGVPASYTYVIQVY